MGVHSTLVVDQHLLALELVQLQLDLMRNRRGQALCRDVGVAAAVVLVRGPGLVHRGLGREPNHAAPGFVSLTLTLGNARRVCGGHGPRDGARGAWGGRVVRDECNRVSSSHSHA